MNRPLLRLLSGSLLSASALVFSAAAQPAAQPSNAEGEVVQLSPFEVIATTDRGYAAANAVSGTRVNMPLMDLPANVTVLTNEFIEDLAEIDVRFVFRYNASSSGFGGTSLRGFTSLTKNVDGFRAEGRQPLPSKHLERIEILKGPSGVLYGGAGAPGGMITYIRKKPVPGRSFLSFFGNVIEVNGEFSHGYGLDVNDSVGPIDFRIVGAYHDGTGTVHDALTHGGNRMKHFYPSLAFQPLDNLRIVVGYQFMEERVRSQYTASTPAAHRFGTVPMVVKYDLDPFTDWGYGRALDNATTDIFAIADLKVDETFSIRLGWNGFSGNSYNPSEFRYSAFELQETTATGTPVLGANGQPIIHPVIRQEFVRSKWDRYIDDYLLSATKEFSIGESVQRLFLSAQIQDLVVKDNFSYPATTLDGARAPNIIAGPGYFVRDPNPAARQYRYVFVMDEPWPRALPGGLYFPNEGRVRRTYESFDTYTLNWLGKFMDGRLHVMGGGSYTKWNRRGETNHDTGQYLSSDMDRINPQIGFNYELVPDTLALFATYSESMNTIPNRDGYDRPFPKPESAFGYEVGVKFDLFQNMLSGTVSAFETTNRDLVVTDPTAPNQRWEDSGATPATRDPRLLGAMVQIGEAMAQGFEVETLGTFGSQANWQVRASYAYLDSEITKDPRPGQVGMPVSRDLRHSAAIWTKYMFKGGSLDGLYVGGGYVWRSEEWAGPSRGRLPATKSLDLLIGYEGRAWGRDYRIALNATGVTEEEDVFHSGTLNPATGKEYAYKRPRITTLSFETRF